MTKSSGMKAGVLLSERSDCHFFSIKPGLGPPLFWPTPQNHRDDLLKQCNKKGSEKEPFRSSFNRYRDG